MKKTLILSSLLIASVFSSCTCCKNKKNKEEVNKEEMNSIKSTAIRLDTHKFEVLKSINVHGAYTAMIKDQDGKEYMLSITQKEANSKEIGRVNTGDKILIDGELRTDGRKNIIKVNKIVKLTLKRQEIKYTE